MSSWHRPDLEGVGKHALGALSGFKKFILRGNVVDLAVGIIIGAAFTTVVNSLVNDIIDPLIPGFKNGLKGLSTPVPWGGSINWGNFISAVITFLIVAFVVYFFVVTPVNDLIARFKPKEAEVPKTRDCPYCFSSVNILATRCAYCTSPLPPAQEQAPAQPAGRQD